MALAESSNGTHWNSTSKGRLWVQKSWVTGWGCFWTQHQHDGLSWCGHQDVTKNRCKASCSFHSFIHLWEKVRNLCETGKYNLSPTWKSKCKLGRILIPYLSQKLLALCLGNWTEPESSQKSLNSRVWKGYLHIMQPIPLAQSTVTLKRLCPVSSWEGSASFLFAFTQEPSLLLPE